MSRFPGGPASLEAEADARAVVETIQLSTRVRQQRSLEAASKRGWRQIGMNAQFATCSHPEHRQYLFIATNGSMRVGRVRATAKVVRVEDLP